MNQQEFLQRLQEALEGEIPLDQIESHLSYYREYLMNPSDGRTTEDRLRELGDPRLIARTIIDTASAAKGSQGWSRTKAFYSGEAVSQDIKTSRGSGSNSGGAFRMYNFSWNGLRWYQKILLVLIGLLAMFVIIGIIVVGVNLFFSIILPVLVVLFLIRIIIRMMQR